MSITNIPATWVPIMHNTKETFVSGSDNVTIIENVFIVLAAVIITTILSASFYWTYNKSKKLFISLLSFIVFLYSLMNIIGIVIIRNNVSNIYYKIYLGAGVISGSLAIILIILFGTLASRELYSQYVPP